jgi:hypothetical protein
MEFSCTNIHKNSYLHDHSGSGSILPESSFYIVYLLMEKKAKEVAEEVFSVSNLHRLKSPLFVDITSVQVV